MDLHSSKKRINLGPRKTSYHFRIIALRQAVGQRGCVLEELHNYDPSGDLIWHPFRAEKPDANQEAKVPASSLLDR